MVGSLSDSFPELPGLPNQAGAVPARPRTPMAIAATTGSERMWADTKGRLGSRSLSRSRATATSSVPNFQDAAAMSGIPADSGEPAAGPKGSPTVREHNHSASGTIETAATALSRARCRLPSDNRPRASWAAANCEEGTGCGPLAKMLPVRLQRGWRRCRPARQLETAVDGQFPCREQFAAGSCSSNRPPRIATTQPTRTRLVARSIPLP